MKSGTILLTSGGMRVKEEIIKLFPKPISKIKLAHIITASLVEKNTSYVDKDMRKLTKAGFQVENIDIKDKTEKDLYDILKNKDVIYVQGGNTFYLLKCTKDSGFDKVVKKLIKQGVVYIGVSAGSYLACPTIEMAKWKHKDRETYGLTDLTALNLVPFLLSVHYKPEYRDILKREIPQTKYPIKILTDKQAILVKNNEIKLVGDKKEVILE